MTWAKRILGFIANDPQPVSATRLELAYGVPHPRRELASLREQGCIELAFSVGRERFWKVRVEAPMPVDRRLENKTHIALRARQIKRLRRL